MVRHRRNQGNNQESDNFAKGANMALGAVVVLAVLSYFGSGYLPPMPLFLSIGKKVAVIAVLVAIAVFIWNMRRRRPPGP